MEAQRIDIKQFDIANEKVSESVQLFIELGENYLMYVGEYYASSPKDKDDHSLGWEDVYENFLIKVFRNKIVALEKQFIQKRNLWQVLIEVEGYADTIKWYFQKEKDAYKVYQILDGYIFNQQNNNMNTNCPTDTGTVSPYNVIWKGRIYEGATMKVAQHLAHDKSYVDAYEAHLLSLPNKPVEGGLPVSGQIYTVVK